jgi:hypothetical protein
LFDIYVQSCTPDDGWKDCPKHVECYSKINKSEKLVHLVGFTVEIYYDARTDERQIVTFNFTVAMLIII